MARDQGGISGVSRAWSDHLGDIIASTLKIVYEKGLRQHDNFTQHGNMASKEGDVFIEVAYPV